MARDARGCAKYIVESAVEDTDPIIRATDAHFLGDNVTTVNATAYGKEVCKIGSHVEDCLCARD